MDEQPLEADLGRRLVWKPMHSLQSGLPGLALHTAQPQLSSSASSDLAGEGGSPGGFRIQDPTPPQAPCTSEDFLYSSSIHFLGNHDTHFLGLL